MDTDKMKASEQKQGHLIVNHTEAALVEQVCQNCLSAKWLLMLVHQAARALLSSGLPANELGVITLYRQQIKLLSSLLQDIPAVEILTADRSQGRDKECVLMSLTRSNDENKVNRKRLFGDFANHDL